MLDSHRSNSLLLTDFVQIINPALNSIPYAFALLARVNEVQSAPKSAQNNTPPEELLPLWEKIVHFLENFDSRQARYIGSETLEIITVVAALARHLGQVCANPIKLATQVINIYIAWSCRFTHRQCHPATRPRGIDIDIRASYSQPAGP
jgi:hypothetical protein